MLAIWGGGFLDNAQGHFDPLNYFFGAGTATNLGASFAWVLLAGFTVYVVQKKVRAAWAAHKTRAASNHADAMSHHKHQTMLIEELHHLAHTGQPHPRVTARIKAGKLHTPPRSKETR